MRTNKANVIVECEEIVVVPSMVGLEGLLFFGQEKEPRSSFSRFPKVFLKKIQSQMFLTNLTPS